MPTAQLTRYRRLADATVLFRGDDTVLLKVFVGERVTTGKALWAVVERRLMRERTEVLGYTKLSRVFIMSAAV